MTYTSKLKVEHAPNGVLSRTVFAEASFSSESIGECFDSVLEYAFVMNQRLYDSTVETPGMETQSFLIFFEHPTNVANPEQVLTHTFPHIVNVSAGSDFNTVHGQVGAHLKDAFRSILHYNIHTRYPAFKDLSVFTDSYDEPYCLDEVKLRAFSGVMLDLALEEVQKVKDASPAELSVSANILQKFYPSHQMVESAKSRTLTEVQYFFLLGSYSDEDTVLAAVAEGCPFPRVLALLTGYRHPHVRRGLANNKHSTVSMLKELFEQTWDESTDEFAWRFFSHPKCKDADLAEAFVKEYNPAETIAKAYYMKYPEHAGYPVEWVKELLP